MVRRRAVIRAGGSALAVGGLSGCLHLLRRGSVGVRIENRDDTSHVVGIEFQDGGDTVFSEQYTAPAGEEVRESDVVPPGEYAVTTTLDSSASETLDFDVEGCPGNSLSVIIDETGEFEHGVLDEC